MADDEYDGLADVFSDVLSMPLPDIDRELVSSGLLDSMAIIALIVEIEDKFDIEISTDDLDLASFGTVRRMAAMVRQSRDGPR